MLSCVLFIRKLDRYYRKGCGRGLTGLSLLLFFLLFHLHWCEFLDGGLFGVLVLFWCCFFFFSYIAASATK